MLQVSRQGGNVRIIDSMNKVGLTELRQMAADMFGDLVKAVVDVKQGIMAIDAELHADEEAMLLENGSDQSNLWGINLYPELEPGDFVEYDSMINLRPAQGNRGRGVENLEIRARIQDIVSSLVIR